MLKEQTTWRANRATRAMKRLHQIEASISALQDDDLLDLADIFVGQPHTPLGKIASEEMAKRKIGL